MFVQYLYLHHPAQFYPQQHSQWDPAVYYLFPPARLEWHFRFETVPHQACDIPPVQQQKDLYSIHSTHIINVNLISCKIISPFNNDRSTVTLWLNRVYTTYYFFTLL
jgi:hypothetical protein